VHPIKVRNLSRQLERYGGDSFLAKYQQGFLDAGGKGPLTPHRPNEYTDRVAFRCALTDD
jgi:hypothetical protein